MKNPSFPINAHNEDKLGFTPFAKRVAQGILNYKQQEAFVISIEGKWGSGKTSLVNLIEKEIQDEVEVMRFSPWLVADLHQVVKLFFDELITVLSRLSFDAKWNEQIKKDIKTLVSVIAPENVSVSTGVLSATWKLKPKSSPSKTQSLEAIKKSINGYLQGLHKKIVIIIDDIDRLTDKETEFIFRLVKGIADFDNVIYLLLYDKEIVARSLETFKKESGERYLEKIVQYPLRVPSPHRIALDKIFSDEMEKIFPAFKKNGDWRNVEKDIIPRYIHTMRDVNLLESILSFEYPIIAQDVNFTDFFLLSLLKIKKCTLYDEIASIGSRLSIFVNDRGVATQAGKEHFNVLLEKYSSFKDILLLLFPMFGSAVNPGIDKEYFKRNLHKHLADPYCFENYFAFSVSDDKLSYAKFKELEKLFLGNDFNGFEQEISGKYGNFLEMFRKNSRVASMKNEALKNGFYNAVKFYKKFHEELVCIPHNRAFMELPLLFFEEETKEQSINGLLDGGNKIPLWVKVDIFQEISTGGLSQTQKETFDEHFKTELTSLKITDFLSDLHNIRALAGGGQNGLGYFKEEFERCKQEFDDFIFENSVNFFTVLEKFKYKNGFMSECLELIIESEKIKKYIQSLSPPSLGEKEKELLQLWNKGLE